MADKGNLKIQVNSTIGYVPVRNATISISYTGESDQVLEEVTTDQNGQTEEEMCIRDRSIDRPHNFPVHSIGYFSLSGVFLNKSIALLNPDVLISLQLLTPIA